MSGRLRLLPPAAPDVPGTGDERPSGREAYGHEGEAMKKLKTFEFPEFGGGKATYEWPKLLDGTIWELAEGTDYTCKTQTFVALARATCKKLGKTLRAAKTETGVVIQATAKTEAE